MLSSYLIPLKTAVTYFPVTALLFTLPYVLWQYHTFGSISKIKAFVVYSFIFYMIAAYFLVILPLPSVESVMNSSSSRHVILEPLEMLRQYIKNSDGNFTGRREILRILKSSPMLQLIFNILLVFPFGIYLRWYFKRGLKQTVLFSFLLSLFYELTQLSGLYGIYPRPYRFFELDDLMCNTLGGLLGYVVAPVFWYFFPTREKMDQKAREKSVDVSIYRRLTAAAVDWAVIWIIKWGFEKIFDIQYVHSFGSFTVFVAVMCIYMIVSGVVTGGWSLGSRICSFHISGKDGKKAGIIRIGIRYLLLYGVIVNGFNIIPAVLYYMVDWHMPFQVLGAIFVMAMFVLLLLFGFETLLKLFGGRESYLYERVSRTKCQSSIQSEVGSDSAEVSAVDVSGGESETSS